MSTYAATSLGCSYRYVFSNELIRNEQICKAAGEDTKSAVKDYLALVLALLSRVPDDDDDNEDSTKPKPRTTRKKPQEDSIASLPIGRE